MDDSVGIRWIKQSLPNTIHVFIGWKYLIEWIRSITAKSNGELTILSCKMRDVSAQNQGILPLSRIFNRVVSTRLNDERYQYVHETTDERDVSQAEVLREQIERGIEYDDLEREKKRLETRVRKLIGTREEHDELIEYVEEEQSLQHRREERSQANVFQRAWWWIAGTPDESEG